MAVIRLPSLGMPARRDRGTGSLRWRTNRWISQTRHPVSGRIVSITHPAGITEDQAEALHRAWLDKIAAEHMHADRTTLRRLVDDWLESRDDLAPATRASYRRALDLAVARLGPTTRVAAIGVRQVDECLADLRRTHKPGTVRNVRATLSSVLHQAEVWQMIDRNPVPLARRVRSRQQAELVVPSLDDVRKAVAAETDTMWRAMFTVLAGVGCRRGECLALAWRHVDLDAATVTIERTMTSDDDGRVVVGDATKTRRPRVVPIGPDAVGALRAWRLESASTGVWRIKPDALLWASPRDHSRPVSARTLADRWRDACVAAGVAPVRVGSLRHAHASLLLSLGWPAQVAADRLGHGIEQTTGRYGIWVPDGAARQWAATIPAIVGDATS